VCGGSGVRQQYMRGSVGGGRTYRRLTGGFIRPVMSILDSSTVWNSVNSFRGDAKLIITHYYQSEKGQI
jgi:hypothetical protein